MSATAKYSLFYCIFLAIVAGGLLIWNTTAPAEKVLPMSYLLLGFFAVVYYLNHLFLLNAENKKPAVFIRRFMATTALRLFVFVIVIFAYALTHKDTARLFIFHILAFYFAFTVFEISSLYRHFQKK